MTAETHVEMTLWVTPLVLFWLAGWIAVCRETWSPWGAIYKTVVLFFVWPLVMAEMN